MQNTQIVAERIKLQAKSKGMSIKKVLEICELGPNTITKMSNGADIVSQSLRKIADYLEVSTDYLLGRTDNPNGVYTNGDNNVMINGANSGNNLSFTSIHSPDKQPDNLTAEFMKTFDELELTDKIDVMRIAVDKTKK